MNMQKVITHTLTIIGIIVGIFLLYLGIRDAVFYEIYGGVLFIIVPVIILLGWHYIYGNANFSEFIFKILFGFAFIFMSGGALYMMINNRSAYRDFPFVWIFAFIPVIMIVVGIYVIVKPFIDKRKKK